MQNYIFIYITNPDEQSAVNLAKKLLEAKLIACANVYASKSLYFWKGKLNDEPEHNLLVKTRAEKYDDIVKFVKENHPYSVPCITKFEVVPNSDYAAWLDDQLTL